ncbi:MAG: response regulator [Aggregatilineales bacterium]
MSAIVLIEDAPQSARLAARLLQLAGHEVIVAESGEAGLLAVMNGPPPDLVLVDLGLPDLDGQTVVALLRQQPDLDTVPIIAFTAWPQDTAHKMALAYGCDGVITKPIDTRTFAGQVEAHIRQQRVQL